MTSHEFIFWTYFGTLGLAAVMGIYLKVFPLIVEMEIWKYEWIWRVIQP